MKSSDKKFKSSYSGPKRKGNRKQKQGHSVAIFVGCVALVAVVAAGATALGEKSSRSQAQTETMANEDAAAATAGALTVSGVDVSGMGREEATAKLLEKISVDPVVSDGEKEYSLDGLTQSWMEACLEAIYKAGAVGDYSLDEAVLKELLTERVSRLADEWNAAPKNAVLERFDNAAGRFVFREGCFGMALQEQKLVSDLLSAVQKDGDAATVVLAEFQAVEPDFLVAQAQERYKTLATVTMGAGDNANWNANVKLAAETLNGTIVRPGEEFSFHAIVGEATEAKGYRSAAYADDGTPAEVGGGISLVSSALYRVAFQSGLEITLRRSLSTEPDYVTPGQEAAIGWELPDFRFVNPSPYPIGIRAGYSDQKVTVAIYGIPLLEDGVTWDLYSERTETLDAPEPVYIEDDSLAVGEEEIERSGTNGSRWVTWKIVSQYGVETERIEDHVKNYEGQAALIRRNRGDETAESAQTGEAVRESDVVSETAQAAETTKAAETTRAAETTKAAETTRAAETTKAAETTIAAETTQREESTSETETSQVAPPAAISAPRAVSKPAAVTETTAAAAETTHGAEEEMPIVPPLS